MSGAFKPVLLTFWHRIWRISDLEEAVKEAGFDETRCLYSTAGVDGSDDSQQIATPTLVCFERVKACKLSLLVGGASVVLELVQSEDMTVSVQDPELCFAQADLCVDIDSVDVSTAELTCHDVPIASFAFLPSSTDPTTWTGVCLGGVVLGTGMGDGTICDMVC